MKVGWLHDRIGYVGGAELTEREFRAAAPDDVEIVECPPGDVNPDLDVYCIHNSVTYSLADLQVIPWSRPTWRYWNDVGSWLGEFERAWLDDHATPICCSPLQAEYMRLENPILIPPPVDLSRFYDAALRVNGNRAGAVSIASWRNRGKGAHRVMEWAQRNEPVDFYGGGAFAPGDSREVAYEEMPGLLAQYRTFVYLPDVIEPFGRCVVEAHAAGLEIVTNGLVGARYWLEEKPDALHTAAEDFWRTVLDGLTACA